MRWFLLFALACDPGTPSEGVAAASDGAAASDPFIRAIQGGDLSVEERLQMCAEVSDPDMGADCSAMVVKSIPGGPEQACPLIPEGRWQDECWFEAAEMRLDQGSMDELLGHCERAGRFSEACKSHVGSILVDRIISQDAAASVGRMRSLAGEWSARSGKPRDSENLWRLYWQGRMERDSSVTVADCRMVNHQPRICEQAWEAVQRMRNP